MRLRPVYPIVLWSMVLLTAGCRGQRESDEAAPAALVPVKLSTVRQGDMPLGLVVLGQTEALAKEIVVSPVGGVVTSLSVSEGTAVRVGEVLAVIQTRESQTSVAGAEALRAAATTPRERAEAERALQLAESQEQTVRLVAHRNGVVARRNVVAGSQVADGTELFTIIDPTSIEFVVLVPIRELPSVAVGQTASVGLSSLDSVLYGAVVAAVSPESELQTQAVRVRLGFADVNSEQRRLLKDGLSGTARIETGRHSGVLLVPRAALLRNDETSAYAIVTLTADSLAQTMPVTVSVMTDSLAEVSAPNLRDGMPVVIEGHYALADSTRVTVVPQTAP